MNCKHLGHSPDIVKQRLLQWLSPCGKWSVHPMFTAPEPNGDPYQDGAQPCRRFAGRCAAQGVCADDTFRMSFCPLIGAWPVTMATLAEAGGNRNDWLVVASRRCKEHLFIDPDTGFRLQGDPPQHRNPEKFLLGNELVAIARARPSKLTLVYDQSINRDPGPGGDMIAQIRAKLRFLEQYGIYGLTYQSQLTFMLVSMNTNILTDARGLLHLARLPADRLIEV